MLDHSFIYTVFSVFREAFVKLITSTTIFFRRALAAEASATPKAATGRAQERQDEKIKKMERGPVVSCF